MKLQGFLCSRRDDGQTRGRTVPLPTGKEKSQVGTVSGVISEGKKAWEVLGRRKQNWTLLRVPLVLKGRPTADLTGQAPSQDSNIFTSCLPRPLAWAGEQLPELSH